MFHFYILNEHVQNWINIARSLRLLLALYSVGRTWHWSVSQNRARDAWRWWTIVRIPDWQWTQIEIAITLWPREERVKPILNVRRLDGSGHCLFQHKPAQGLREATAVGFVPHDRPNVCFPKFGPLSVACRVWLLHRVKIWTLLAELTFP
jgi:hypothetical protein